MKKAGHVVRLLSWLGIESLVKTFDSGEDEQNDINEIKQLLDETSGDTDEELAL